MKDSSFAGTPLCLIEQAMLRREWRSFTTSEPWWVRLQALLSRLECLGCPSTVRGVWVLFFRWSKSRTVVWALTVCWSYHHALPDPTDQATMAYSTRVPQSSRACCLVLLFLACPSTAVRRLVVFC